MNIIQKEAENAYKLLAAIPVYGDAVETMAAARECLRRIYKRAGETECDPAETAERTEG